jgi:hypothetical protein
MPSNWNVIFAGSGGGIGIDGVTHPAITSPMTMAAMRMVPGMCNSKPRSITRIPDIA